MNEIQFTKAETNFLDPKNQERLKLVMWVGIACILLSIMLIPYFLSQTEQVRQRWEASFQYFQQNVMPVTQLEMVLKESLLQSKYELKELWTSHLTYQGVSISFIFFLFGCYVLAGYRKERIYISLIMKLRESGKMEDA